MSLRFSATNRENSPLWRSRSSVDAPGARWSSIDLTDGLLEGGKMDIASIGLTWWLTPFFGANANYRYIWNDLDGLESNASGINGRLMLMLE